MPTPLRRRLLQTSLVLCVLAGATAAQTCQVTSVGRTCAATLRGSLQGGPALRLDLTAPGNTGGFLVFGLQRVTIVLPAGCELYTVPLVHVPYTVGMQGTASWTLPIPRGVVGTVRAQGVPILRAQPGVIIRSSNAIEIVCR